MFPARVSYKSVPQSDESVARECPTRAFYNSVSYKGVQMFGAIVFEHVFAFGFVHMCFFMMFV